MTCSIAGCGKPVLTRGWCSRHYKRWHRHGDPLVAKRGEQMSADGQHRTCPGCNVERPLTDFIKRVRNGRVEWTRCKPCLNEKARQRYTGPESNRQARRKSKLQKSYGITPEQYEALLAEQGGVCALCGGDNQGRTLAVDHCHNTGAVRGLLCTRCNLHLGGFEQLGITWVIRAQAYLSRDATRVGGSEPTGPA